MKATELLTPDLIKLELVANSKEEALNELVDVLAEADKLNSRDQFYQTILDREESSSTGVGHGVAIPHGKSEAVKEPALVFGKSDTGIDFDSRDGEPAKIFFMIAVPEKSSQEHLKILSGLSRKLMHDDFRQALLGADKAEQVLEVLNEHE